MAKSFISGELGDDTASACGAIVVCSLLCSLLCKRCTALFICQADECRTQRRRHSPSHTRILNGACELTAGQPLAGRTGPVPWSRCVPSPPVPPLNFPTSARNHPRITSHSLRTKPPSCHLTQPPVHPCSPHTASTCTLPPSCSVWSPQVPVVIAFAILAATNQRLPFSLPLSAQMSIRLRPARNCPTGGRGRTAAGCWGWRLGSCFSMWGWRSRMAGTSLPTPSRCGCSGPLRLLVWVCWLWCCGLRDWDWWDVMQGQVLLYVLTHRSLLTVSPVTYKCRRTLPPCSHPPTGAPSLRGGS
jgi:hypothetical protein